MPSAFECRRSFKNDLAAIAQYAKSAKISAERRSQTKLALRDLARAFSRYQSHFQAPRKLLLTGRLSNLSPFLYSLYGSKASVFSYISEIREAKEIGACLYCGLPKTISVDHYLPRDENAFPHLSVLSTNLVPACSSCQNLKSNFYPNHKSNGQTPSKRKRRQRLVNHHITRDKYILRQSAVGHPNRTLLERRRNASRMPACSPLFETRRIVHPYFDDFLEAPAFDMRLTWIQDVPVLEELIFRPRISRRQRKLLTFHLKKLKVKDYAQKAVLRAHQAFVSSISEQGINATEVKQRIKSMMRYKQRDAGIANAIEVAFFREILENDKYHQDQSEKSAQRKTPMISEARAYEKKVSKQKKARKALGR